MFVQKMVSEYYSYEDYPCCVSRGEPHSWQPVQMRSVTKLVSPALDSLLLMNIFSFSDSPRVVVVNGRKISPTDAVNTALHESVKRDTSNSEKQSLDFLSSGSFQFRLKCIFFFVDCCHNYTKRLGL